MEKSSCKAFLMYVPSISEHEELRSTYVVNSICNIFLSYTAIMLNVITIHAMRKTWFLPKPLKTLLLSLAVSDVGVGLVVQPYYTSLLFQWLHYKNPGCFSYKLYFFVMSLFAIASFLGVVAVSLDRFLAIQLHLRYQQVVTQTHVVSVVISLWVLSALIAVTTFWYPYNSSVVIVAVGTVCLFITTLIYVKIYMVFRRHKIQIQQTLQVQQLALGSSDAANFANLKKSAVGVFYVYILFLVCYLPRGFSLFAWTAMFLNSSLNPVVYCLKMRHIRHAVFDLLRNASHYRSFLSR